MNNRALTPFEQMTSLSKFMNEKCVCVCGGGVGVGHVKAFYFFMCHKIVLCSNGSLSLRYIHVHVKVL